MNSQALFTLTSFISTMLTLKSYTYSVLQMCKFPVHDMTLNKQSSFHKSDLIRWKHNKQCPDYCLPDTMSKQGKRRIMKR